MAEPTMSEVLDEPGRKHVVTKRNVQDIYDRLCALVERWGKGDTGLNTGDCAEELAAILYGPEGK